MAPVAVVGGTSAFRRHHGRPQGIVGRAPDRECRAVGRLPQSLQHLCTDAFRRFIRGDQVKIEDLVCVVCGVLVPQAQAALRNHADSPPLLVANFKHFSYRPLRKKIAVIAHGSHVLVFNLGLPCFQLYHHHEHSLQQVHGFESSNDDGDREVSYQPFVFPASHDRADMARCDESLYAVFV